MNPSEDAYDISLKGGNMLLNRFCIDEDAAFELSGVNYLKETSRYMDFRVKGKENSFLWSNFNLRNLIFMNN